MPSLLQRLFGAGAATRAPHLDRKASRTGPLVAHLSLGMVRYAPRDAVELTRLGYEQNPVAYRAVRMVAEAAASIPWRAYEGRDEDEAHPALALVHRPNPVEVGPVFLESLISNLLLFGNAYVEAVSVDGTPRELYALRPDRLSIVPGPNGWPQAYEYLAGGERVRYDIPAQGLAPILHLKFFHPLDDHYGFAPMKAAQTALETHNAAAGWNRALLDNAARPSGALVYSGPEGATLSEDQFERLKAELDENYSGMRNAGRPLLLEGGLDFKPLSLSPKDMDFIEAKAAAARDIALAFGVPPLLLGLRGDNTYSNYQEANRAFWRQTVIPLVARVQASFAHWLAPAFGDFRFDYDVDRLDALAEERAKEWTRIAGAAFLTDDEKREAVGYGPRGGKAEGDGVDTSGPADPAAQTGGGGDGANGGFWREQPRDPTNGQWVAGDGARVELAAERDIGSPQKLIRQDGTTYTNPYRVGDDQTIYYPSDFPPEKFIKAGERARALIETSSTVAGISYLAADLTKFRQGGEWDLQRLATGVVDSKYVDYATVAIGLYASSAGMPKDEILSIQNSYAYLRSRFGTSVTMDPVYTNLPSRNVLNTEIGYEIASRR